MHTVGTPFPGRQIRNILLITVGVIAVVAVVALLGRNPAGAWFALLFLLIPAISIPVWLRLNSWAVINEANWTISINGSTFRPLTDITYGATQYFRGVSTVMLGFDQKHAVSVSAFSPTATPKSERAIIKHVLPFTGIPAEGEYLPAKSGFWSLPPEHRERLVDFANRNL